MIETERLRLYPASREEMERFIAAEQDEELRKAYGEMLEGCLRLPEQWAWYAMWMIERKDGTHIGDLCFKGLGADGIAEIGYGILDEYQGLGYATEAVKAALSWAFQHPEVRAVEAETAPENAASQRVLEKCGFVPKGIQGEEGPRFVLSRLSIQGGETMHILENTALRVAIADKGAELCSVIDKASHAERIWTADPAVWNRHAPILFPFVGKVTGGKYRIGDREYSMKTQHGFARDLCFACVEATAELVRHRLMATEETLALYPYAFSLEVTHALDPAEPRQLNIAWAIKNCGSETMYYSIGGHPGFLMPEGVDKENCFLYFPGKSSLSYFSANAAGFSLPDIRHELCLQDGYARYQEDVPDTWIFSDHSVAEVGIALPDRAPYVTLNCEQFPLLAVWANPKGRFICLEPWFGRTDDDGFIGSLAEKPGIETLLPGEMKKISYSILFHAYGK